MKYIQNHKKRKGNTTTDVKEIVIASSTCSSLEVEACYKTQ